jgi:AraC-like DNA-binding protein
VAELSREQRYTGSAGLCLVLLGALREMGHDPVALLARTELHFSDLLNPETRIPLTKMWALWRAAEQVTGDEALGISVASRIDPKSNMSWPAPFSIHEHVGRSSATMRESIVRQARILRLLRDAVTITLEELGADTLVRFDFASLNEPRSLKHFQMAAGMLFSRRVVADDLPPPREVRFAHPAPADVGVFERFFQAPLRFEAQEFGFLVESALLAQPLPTANPQMLFMLEQRAKTALEALPAVDDFVQLVRERIEAELPDGNTNASHVAEKLGISQRTLHRKLQAESTSYQDLLDQVRCRLAQRHLVLRKHSINEVAALVGFAQPSAFHRAFKGWTGETPADYQQRLSTGSVPPPTPTRR